ncbi:hypothetical protein DRP04_06075 [Archaeoglobales archaeon]|mgnify:CR=1 FL=1|nr:MAG: hypothetical protein DRP04_06075 [Archaeoglobales archaeon]
MKVKVVNVVGIGELERALPLEKIAVKLQDLGWDIDVIELHEAVWRVDFKLREGKVGLYRQKFIAFAENEKKLKKLAKKVEKLLKEVDGNE